MSEQQKEALKPFLKWAGGKEKELPYIEPNLPQFNRFFEPFAGGGAVFLAMNKYENVEKLYINDKSHELISLYEAIKKRNTNFFQSIQLIWDKWKETETIIAKDEEALKNIYIQYREEKIDEAMMKKEIENYIETNKMLFENVVNPFINSKGTMAKEVFYKELEKNVKNKFARTKKLEKDKGLLPEEDIFKNIETGFKSGLYMYLRYLYNNISLLEIDDSMASALFYYIREYCYSSMFRYNAKGEFNVPYGGLSYNRKDFQRKIDYMKDNELVQHLQKTTVVNKDFEEFLEETKPNEDDFIFLDPPYDSDFSTYANNSFDREEQERLANYLLTQTKGQFMMVIKNTDFIYNLYHEKTDMLERNIHINAFDKTYLVSFKNRNNRDCEHLIITNYEIPETE